MELEKARGGLEKDGAADGEEASATAQRFASKLSQVRRAAKASSVVCLYDESLPTGCFLEEEHRTARRRVRLRPATRPLLFMIRASLS